ncbi:DUF1272 domain-containing protein [Gilvibacter sp.]|uniref:DUF1272 domain-containing protein n=1 Tax=Gilvibacter sp. TaxID=2729997 RepID=UPI0035BE9090
MLEIRPSCEHCNKPLAVDSTEAMICTFECTFCKDCVSGPLREVCPNCGGGFTPRPIRPENKLAKHPPSDKVVYKPVDLEAHYKKHFSS